MNFRGTRHTRKNKVYGRRDGQNAAVLPVVDENARNDQPKTGAYDDQEHNTDG